MKLLKLFSAAVFTLMSFGTAQAAWTNLSDFESLAPGDLGNQGSWTSVSAPNNGYFVAADPDDAGNQALEATGANSRDDGSNAYISLGAGIAEGATGTVFFRMRNAADGDLVFGASDVAAPAEWGDYEGYMRFAGGNIDVRNSNTFAAVGTYNADEWYNIWLVLDNAADTTQLYASQGSNPAVALGSPGNFRNGTTDALSTLNVRLGVPQTTAVGYIDDVYVDAMGVNLGLPTIPEPTSALLAISGVAALLASRRR